MSDQQPGIRALLDAHDDAVAARTLNTTETTIARVREARHALLRYVATACPTLDAPGEERAA